MANTDPSIGLIAYVHSLGLKFGLYTSAGDINCSGTNWPGSYGYEATDSAKFLAWGVDYVKVDWCASSALQSQLTAQGCDFYSQCFIKKESNLWRKYMGSNVVLSISASGAGAPWQLYNDPLAPTMWRTGHDIDAAWATALPPAPGDILYIINQTHLQESLPYLGYSYQSNGHWSDPDMLEVGVPAVNGRPGLTFDEAKSHFSLWSSYPPSVIFL